MDNINLNSLKIFLEKSLQPVVVEVELPDNELAIRRIGFYQRLGFHLEEHFNYCMPNYNNKGFTPMNLMIYPSLMSNEDCKNIAAEIYEKVRAIAEEFKKTNHSIVCKELLGLSKPEISSVPEERTAEYYKKRPCVQIVEDAAKATEKILFSEVE